MTTPKRRTNPKPSTDRTQSKPRRRDAAIVPATVNGIPAAGMKSEWVTFALEYVANGQRATAAYQAAYPVAQKNTAGVESTRLLAHPVVSQFIRATLQKHWEGLHMTADEALAHMATLARPVDPSRFYGAAGLLPPSRWPKDLVHAIRGIREGALGRSLQLASPEGPLRTILEHTGAIKSTGSGLDALADAILADRKKHGVPDDAT